MAYLRIAENLDSKLMHILLNEISLGNVIFEAVQNSSELRVSLIYSFKDSYPLSSDIRGREDSDPHYNVREYFTDSSFPHFLSAPFHK